MLKVTRIDAQRGLDRFIDVPWRVYEGRGHPSWVPPLRRMRREVLDPEDNPLFREAEIALFLARRDGRTVGRVAAVENEAHNRFHGDRTGFFGFLDAEDDGTTVEALLEAAREWLAGKGLESMRGPVNPTTNYEAGLLVEGFESPPAFMTPWSPPYLSSHVEAAGLRGVKDLLGYHIRIDELDESMRERMARLGEIGRRRHGIEFRRLDLSRFDEEMRTCWRIYTEAWKDNWGFSPPSEDEFLYLTRSLEPLMVADGAVGAEVDGEPVAFLLALPDYNRPLKRIGSGRLLPFGWLRLLRARFRTPWVRIVALGVKPRYRSRAILPLLIHRVLEKGPDYGVTDVEASWVLEDNLPMTRTLESVGARQHRRWRIYERRTRNRS